MKKFLLGNFLEVFFAAAVIVAFAALVLSAPYFHDHKSPPALLGTFIFLVAPIVALTVPVMYAMQKAESGAKKVIAQFFVKVLFVSIFGVITWGSYTDACSLTKYPYVFWNCVGGFLLLGLAMFSLYGMVTCAALKFGDKELPTSED